MKNVYFITHPNVVIDPSVPVPMWPLSEEGFRRMRTFLDHDFINSISSVYSSAERKAIDGATVLAEHLSIDIHQDEELGENDRSSTGFLPSKEFEAIADEFFAHPETSIRGWETATDAQARICRAVDRVIQNDHTAGNMAIVSHGGVGALLLCQLAGYSISRKHDQPGGSGGNFFVFNAATRELLHDWKPIEPSGAEKK